MGKPVPARWRLRVHAEGARGIKAAGGVMGSLDAKPDPYAVFVFNGVTKQIAPVQDVPPVEFFAWPNAVVEFDVADDAVLVQAQAALVVHVKDSDTLKDRFIGGTSIALAPLGLAAAQAGTEPRVLCQSQFFPLDFEDEKLKKKKLSGEIQLTISVVDTMSKSTPPVPEPAKPVVATEVAQTKPTSVEPIVKKETPQENIVAASPDPSVVVHVPVLAVHTEEKKASVALEAPIVGTSTEPAKTASSQPSDVVADTQTKQATETTRRESQPKVAEERVGDVQAEPSATNGGQNGVQTVIETPATQATQNTEPVNVRELKIELVSARNLTRPTSVGALFDRKPDPMVILEFNGLSKTSVPLKDVDLKKPVEWSNALLHFDLPHTPPPPSKRKGCGPMDLIVHIKDENLMKNTYMGGGKIDISELFEPRSETAGWRWQSPSSNIEKAQERVVTLTHSDDKLSKKKACGEITLRFYLIAEPIPVSMKTENLPSEPSSLPVVEPQALLTTGVPDPAKVAVETDTPAPATPKETLTTLAPPISRPVHGDIKQLSIEILSGRGLSKPVVRSLAKSMLKSLFDRRPDPYVEMILGSQKRKCPAVNDVDVAFFEWKNAAQVFDFDTKPYPDMLIIHVRDEDVAGKDPYMGGARIAMREIWSEASARATCNPPGDPQLVITYPLTFDDEKLTIQKDKGSVTVRFRWIYSDVELPSVEVPSSIPLTVLAEAGEPLKPVPALKSRAGFVVLRNMALYNNVKLDSSLDLYVEASFPSIHISKHEKKESTDAHALCTKSSVLTDAMEGKADSETSKAEWLGDVLTIPVCVLLDGDEPTDVEICIDLKDKNALMKDTELAMKRVRLRDHGIDLVNFQPQTATIQLEPSALLRKSTKTTLKFEAEIQFLPHDSPLLAATSREQHGGIMTLFLIRSVLSPTTKDPPVKDASFTLEIDSLATKKTGLLSFGKSPVSEFRSPSLSTEGAYEGGKSEIRWLSVCNFAVSNKQASTAKEKEAFLIDVIVRMGSGKLEKVIGSLQLNVFTAAFSPTPNICTETIEFGALGSMSLEFVAAFRAISGETSTGAPKKSSKPIAPPVPSGYLHLVILHAKNLVSPDLKDETSDELDPEVRVSIEPKYIKRKENPVRSMLKTKPLENAGAAPTWNEYLRLEYQLPPVPPPQPGSGVGHKRVSEVDNVLKYPPPVVQIGVFDIQMPGEKNGVQAIGKTELPLSAFLLGTSLPGEGEAKQAASAIQLSLDVFLANKKTGILLVEGIFEPAPSDFKAPADDPAEVYRQQCRVIGRDLRERSKKLRSGEMNVTAANLLAGSTRKRGVAGRLEVHLVGFRGGQSTLAREDRGLSAHLWISSSIEDRREVKSKSQGSEELLVECALVWDARLTMFTNDIMTEMLRSEVLTFTGKPVGSLKLPLGGLLEGGRSQREWHALLDDTSASAKKSAKPNGSPSEVLIEISFFADEIVFDPLSVCEELVVDSSSNVVVNCGKVIFLDAEEFGTTEIACKMSLLGAVPSATTKQAATERTSYKVCENSVGMDGKSLGSVSWSEKIKLDVGGSAHAFIAESFAHGTQPAVRFELLAKRPGARFHELFASLSLSLVALLHYPGNKATRWLKIFVDTDGNNKDLRIAALLEVEIAVFCSTSAIFPALREEKLLSQAFEDMVALSAVPGVLCVRFLSGRNLLDVDANGEQDPYIITKVTPRSSFSGLMQSACQTAVSLDGGRHPTWNTGIFELQVQDLLTDYIRLEVIDSNEEDHLPDAFIGAIEIALISLFREHVVAPRHGCSSVWTTMKTRWLEAWIPIYPVTPGAAQTGDTIENAGEVRMEFRFLTSEYYESLRRQQSDTSGASSPFSSTDSVTNPVKGTVCLHIVQAFGLACTTGMQPGVRVAVHGSSSMHLTKAGKRSIVEPVWDSEVVELPWPLDDNMTGGGFSNSIRVEIVDLAVRTANTSALAVIAFGQIDISSFLAHHLARSYHVYPLHGRQSPGKCGQNPALLIGCQFVPEGKEKEAAATEQKLEKRRERRTGNLHIRCTQLCLDMTSYLNLVHLDATLAIRLQSCTSKGISGSDDAKTVEIPAISLAELVQKNGRIELSGDKMSLLFTYAGDMSSADVVVVANPIMIGELVARSAKGEATVVAEFEVPVFDYVLFDGHLGSAWYKLTLNDPMSGSTTRLGEVHIEVQFLPVLAAPPPSLQSMSDAQGMAGVLLLEIVVKKISGWRMSPCCLVAVDFLGCSAETKPNVSKSSTSGSLELSWNETLDLAVSKELIRSGTSSMIMKLEIRDPADSSVVYGSCNWIVPRDLIAFDGTLVADSSDIVVPIQLPVGLDKNSKRKTDATPPELTFQLIRTDKGGVQITGAVRRRRGLFYIQLAANDAASVLRNTKAALVTTAEIEKVNTNESLPGWVELSSGDVKVLPLYADSKVDLQSVVIVTQQESPTTTFRAVLDGEALNSIVMTPATETFHQLPLRPMQSELTASPSRVGCKITYAEGMQGQLQFELGSVMWALNKGRGEKVPGSFRLELRLTTGVSQRWVSSPLGFWNRKTKEIAWPASKNQIAISYTNAEEQAEPSIQLVLMQMMDSDKPKREAFGQISVLNTITRGMRGESEWIPGKTELSRIGDGQASIQLSLQLRFVREEFSFEELEAKLAAERDEKALKLAEGTATLKKAFTAMGGDEHTPISIADFMKHVKESAKQLRGNSDSNAARALEVLQHAADVETDGDLDGLFALMDINGDGQISWDEYVEHMQNIHALADAAATRSIEKQKEATRELPTDNATEDTPGPEFSDKEDDEDDRDTGNGETEGNDSDLDDDRIIDLPAKRIPAGAGIQDIYSVPLPTGEQSKEAGETSQMPRLSQSMNSMGGRNDQQPSGPERKASSRPPRSSIQSISSIPQVEPRADLRLEQRRDEPVQPPKKKLPLLSTYVLDWKVDEVVQWMTHEMELGQYADSIIQNAVNGKLLLTLSEQEIESELGITAILHKRKIVNQIREFQERFQYPPPEPIPTAKKRPNSTKKMTTGTFVTSSLVSDTPAFIKREQLVFQEKQCAKQEATEHSYLPKTLGQTRVFPTRTKVIDNAPNDCRSASPAATRTTPSNNKTETGESFDDAMQDIFDVIHPDSPEKPPPPEAVTTSRHVARLPLIQVGSITNTDELFEIVRQRIHQLSELLLPMAAAEKESWSDFGDDPDDDEGGHDEPSSEERTGLRLIYDAFRRARPSAFAERISRLKFQEGMAELLSIDVSWHQFDLLFRRLDVDGDSELCWDEFHHVFTKRHISFEREDVVVLQEALVDFAMARLDSQQWTLSDLFKAFDRDGGGSVSIAEFATLVRFLFTSSTHVKRFQQQTKHAISKRHVYLLMSCLDVSADRRISLHEFLRFFFIVWSSKLMHVQDHLLELEASHTQAPDPELVSILRSSKRTLRRALRTNFSRPFRDAMRCLDVSVPGPFSGLLSRLQLTTSDAADHRDLSGDRRDESMQVWQVLRGQASGTSHRDPHSGSHQRDARDRTAREASRRRRVQKGQNELQRTRLTRQREPTRAAAILQTPAHHVALDQDATLKLDLRPFST